MPGRDGVAGLVGPRGFSGQKGEKGTSIESPHYQMASALPSTTALPQTVVYNCPPGQKGEQGIQGISGFPGRVGLPGAKGQKGELGERGLRGMPGISTVQASDGNAKTIVQGLPGPPGRDGAKGEKASLTILNIIIRKFAGRCWFNWPSRSSRQEGKEIFPARLDKMLTFLWDKQFLDYDPPGIKGDKGDGNIGLPGSDGRPGQDGRDGVSGQKGEPGERGMRGRTGLRGPKGDQGIPGLDAPCPTDPATGMPLPYCSWKAEDETKRISRRHDGGEQLTVLSSWENGFTGGAD
ncbi:hypothetical protein M3Y97_00728200 [Aphelenchoides bicaudatus]|nr:hypothetical protein M3Y97_00728200 [Aphelenchoides bicaudatus]